MPTDYFKPIINPNPTNYQPAGPIASNLENAAAAVGTTAALGGVGKLVAGALAPGTIPQAVAQSVGQTGPGTLAASAVGGAAEGPVANQVPEEWQPVARMLANVGAGAGVGALGGAGRAAIGAVGPETAQLAQLARDTYNIPIRAGQISGNRVVKSADSALQSVPFSGLQGAAEVQQTALNRAVAQTFGEDADKITPSVLNAARRRIGGVMEDVENRNSIQFDPQLGQDLSGIVQNARKSLTDQEFGVVGRQINNLLSTVQGGEISGQSYGNLIHKGSPLDAMTNNANSNLANYGGQIREALRDSLQRSLNPDDVAAYQGARAQWKNMKTIEPLTLRADVVGGATPSTGDINPAGLRAVVNRSFSNAAYAEPGQVPLNDLANIGQRFLKETPTSQTAERSNVFRWLERGGAVAGAALGGEHYLGVPMGEMMAPAAAAGAATLGLGRVAGKVLGSEGLANRMIQRGLGGAPQGPGIVQRSVPLMTSSGIRQMSSPEQPQTSRNPQTGLPEFSLRANQEAAGQQSGGGATDVASKLLSMVR